MGNRETNQNLVPKPSHEVEERREGEAGQAQIQWPFRDLGL